MKTKTISLIFGITFLAVGILGFIPNPIVGDSDTALFHADKIHNIVHLVSGLLILIFGLFIPSFSRSFLKVFGVIYLLIGVLGFFQIGEATDTTVLGFLHVNQADNFLHLFLGVTIFLAGVLTRDNLKTAV